MSVVCNCCIQDFSGILSKTFSEHCSFCNEIFYIQLKRAFLYLLVAILVDIDAEEFNIEVNIQLLFFGKRQQLLTYSILRQSVNFFVENIVIQITIHMLKSLNKNFAKFNIITEN